MNLTNRNRFNLYNFILTLVNLLLIGGISFFILDKTKLSFLGNAKVLLLLFPIFLLFIYRLRGKEIFEFDSEGEVLNFRNSYILPFLGKEVRDEFPKYKIVSFDVVNLFIFKRLYIKIARKKEQVAVLKYDISYLSSSEIKDLKFSLKEIIAANKEALKEGKMQS